MAVNTRDKLQFLSFILVSTGPIFTIFLPNWRYLREFLDQVQFFQFQGTLPWQPNLCRKQNTNHVRFLQFLHHMNAFWVQMIDLKFISISSGTLPWQPIPDWFARSRSIAGSAGPIFKSLHHTLGIELQMNDTSFFFWYLKGRCHGNRFSVKNGRKLPTPCTYRPVNPKRNGISPCAYAHLWLH